MKILIQNYSSEISTEPLYLDKCFNEAGITSAIWNDNQLSAFDALDRYSPDILLFHAASKYLKDILKYCSQNKKVSICINITGLNQKDIDQIDSIINNNINLICYYSNQDESVHPANSKNKVVRLLPAVDLFIKKQTVPEFKIKTAIITLQDINNIKEECKKYDTYHTINLGRKPGFDINVNILNLVSLYDKYDEIIILDTAQNVFNQLFFESSLYANKTTIKCDNRDLINKNLAKLFSYQKEEKDMSLFIKTEIKNKHNCFIRASKLIEEFDNQKALNNLKNLLNKI
jgi:hypothetical protein